MMQVPGWAWWAAAGLAAIGLGLALWGWIGDRSRGRRRCPRCWYDMTGVPGRRCPECGKEPATDRGLFKPRRRRWAIGVALVLLAPILAATGARFGRPVWYAMLPTWTKYDDQRWGRDRVRLYRLRDPYQRGERALVTRDGAVVADIRETLVFLGGFDGAGQHAAGIMQDITGDGSPEVIIETYSGGAHCCMSTHIVSMGERPREIAVLQTQSEGVRFEPDGEGRMALVTADPAFEYWHTAYVSSARPPLVLRLDESGLSVDAGRMWKPVPSSAVLDDARARIAAKSVPGSGPDPELWITVLNLLYSGHESEGWRFLDDAWPQALPGKEQFRAELRAQLDKSEWWPKVRAAFEGAAAHH